MRVIPPGTDLQRFHPPASAEEQTNIVSEINRFLREPDKPMILALSRADERKNIATLIEAYGETVQLQSLAHLIIIAGNRDDIREMDSGPQSVLKDILLLIDQYDLYVRIAYPKHHGEQYSENGQRGVKDHYSWDAHAKKYYQTLQPILERHEPSPRIPVARRPLLYHDRALFTDLDQNLLGDKQALASLVQFIKQNRNRSDLFRTKTVCSRHCRGDPLF